MNNFDVDARSKMFQTLGLVNNELEEMGQENNPTSA
jgi:hypothetical protein